MHKSHMCCSSVSPSLQWQVFMPCLQHLDQDRERYHPPCTSPPASPPCPRNCCRLELSHHNGVLLGLEHTAQFLCPCVLVTLVQSALYRGPTGSFPDSPPPPVHIAARGLPDLLPKNKAAGIVLSGCLAHSGRLSVGLLATGCVPIFDGDFHSLGIFPPLGRD